MIVVRMELWPHGDPTRKKHLGTAVISNDGQGTLARGNYRVSLSQRGLPLKTWKRSHVRGFPRTRLGAWDLLLCALAGICGPRTQGAGVECAEVFVDPRPVRREWPESLTRRPSPGVAVHALGPEEPAA